MGPQGLQGPHGEQGEQGPPGEGQTINLTIDPSQFPGITAQQFDALFPDAVLNTVEMEIPDVTPLDCFVIVINGPAVETQVVEGYDQNGKHDDHSGLSLELPLVIEIAAESTCHDAIITYHDTFAVGIDTGRPITLIIRDSFGEESLRWNMFEFVPDGYQAGLIGTRFTFVQSLDPIGNLPLRDLLIQREGDTGYSDSYNPATDKKVDIAGIFVGFYPQVVEQTDRTLTLVYDFAESGGLYEWVRLIVENGTQYEPKRDIQISTVDENMEPIESTNYYGCFPIKYEQFTGFVQDIQTKERVLLNCDSSAAAN
jgi:hypothetical protein